MTRKGKAPLQKLLIGKRPLFPTTKESLRDRYKRLTAAQQRELLCWAKRGSLSWNAPAFAKALPRSVE